MPIRCVIDLSKPLDDGTPFYPGDREPGLRGHHDRRHAATA
jgi:kynurenine formamidase